MKAVNDLAFAAPGLLVSCDSEGRVKLWSLPTRSSALLRPRLVLTFDAHSGKAVNALGCSGNAAGPPLFATASDDALVALWDASRLNADAPGDDALQRPPQSPLHRFAGHRSFATSCAFDPAHSHSLLLSASLDGTARLWDARAPHHAACAACLAAGAPVASAVCAPADATVVLAACETGFFLFDLRALRPATLADARASDPFAAHWPASGSQNPPTAALWSRAWAAPPAGAPPSSSAPATPPPPLQCEGATAPCRPSLRFFCANRSAAERWDPGLKRYAPPFIGHSPQAPPCSAVFCPSGLAVFTAARGDPAVKTWRPHDGLGLASLELPTGGASCRLSACASLPLLFAGSSSGAACLFRTEARPAGEAGRRPGWARGPAAVAGDHGGCPVTAVAVRADGLVVASADEMGRLLVRRC